MLKDVTDKFFTKVTPAEMPAEEVNNTQPTDEKLKTEAVILNPEVEDPDDIELQMELDDYDDNGDPKSFDAWDLASDAFHNGDTDAWVANLKRAEHDPEQIYPEAVPVEPNNVPMSDEEDDELAISQDDAEPVEKQSGETNLFNFSDALEALNELEY